MRLRYCLLCIILPSLCLAWKLQNPNPYYTLKNEPTLYYTFKHLFGVYGTYNKAKSHAILAINGFDPQEHSLDEKQFGFGIQFGYLLDFNNRILGNLEHNLKHNGFSYQLLTIGYSFTPQLPNQTHWRLALGINAGLALGKFDHGSFVVNNSALEKLSYWGLTYGVKGGFIHTLSKGELEFGLQARRLDFGKKDGNLMLNGSLSPTSLNLSRTSNVGFYLGYNVFF